jgi:anhydro-N-acetylmuramic acid kinase
LVVTSEHFGWPLPTIEAAAFAYLAYLRYVKKPGNIPNTTGASRAVLLGQVNEG